MPVEIGSKGCTPGDICVVIFIRGKHCRKPFRSKINLLAMTMGVDKDRLDQISGQTPEAILLDLLSIWITQATKTCTVDDFVKILKSVELNKAAKLLEKWFQSPTESRKRRSSNESGSEQEQTALHRALSEISINPSQWKYESNPALRILPVRDSNAPAKNVCCAFFKANCQQLFNCLADYKCTILGLYSVLITIVIALLIYLLINCKKTECSKGVVSFTTVADSNWSDSQPIQNVSIALNHLFELPNSIVKYKSNRLVLNLTLKGAELDEKKAFEDKFENVIELNLISRISVSLLVEIFRIFPNMQEIRIYDSKGNVCEKREMSFPKKLKTIDMMFLTKLTLGGNYMCKNIYHFLVNQLRLESLHYLKIEYANVNLDNIFLQELLQIPTLKYIKLTTNYTGSFMFYNNPNSTIFAEHVTVKNFGNAEIYVDENFCTVFGHLSYFTLLNTTIPYSRVDNVLKCTTIRALNISIAFKKNDNLVDLNLLTKNVLLKGATFDLKFDPNHCPSPEKIEGLFKSVSDMRTLSVHSNCPIDKQAGKDIYTFVG